MGRIHNTSLWCWYSNTPTYNEGPRYPLQTWLGDNARHRARTGAEIRPVKVVETLSNSVCTVLRMYMALDMFK